MQGVTFTEASFQYKIFLEIIHQWAIIQFCRHSTPKSWGVPYREKTSHFFKVFNQLRFIATKTSTYGHWTIGYCAQNFKLHDVKFQTNQVKNKIRSCVGTFGTFMGMGCTFNMLPTLYRAGGRSTISDGACRAKDAQEQRQQHGYNWYARQTRQGLGFCLTFTSSKSMNMADEQKPLVGNLLPHVEEKQSSKVCILIAKIYY